MISSFGRVLIPHAFTPSTFLLLVTTTSLLLQVSDNEGYARPPCQEPEDGLYLSPPSPSDGYPTAPPRTPAVSPYCNQQAVSSGSPHHEQQQTETFQGYVGMAQGLPTPPPGLPVGLPGSPENGTAGDIGLALMLPAGWEAKVLPEGRTMYIDHHTQVGGGGMLWRGLRTHCLPPAPCLQAKHHEPLHRFSAVQPHVF